MEFAYTNASTEIPKQFPRLFNEVNFDPRRSEATIMPIAELGLFRGRTEGGGFSTDSPQELIPATFTFGTYRLSSYLTEEAQLEDPLNLMGMLPQMLSNSERYTQDLLVWNTLNYSFSGLVPGS